MSGHQLRPSKHEVNQKLREAKLLIGLGKVQFANEEKSIGELMALNVGNSSDVWRIIAELLTELQLEDYEGKRPPEKSYEPSIANYELWAFCWDSARMGHRMYLKFALKNGVFFYVSLHKSKFLRKENHAVLEMR